MAKGKGACGRIAFPGGEAVRLVRAGWPWTQRRLVGHVLGVADLGVQQWRLRPRALECDCAAHLRASRPRPRFCTSSHDLHVHAPRHTMAPSDGLVTGTGPSRLRRSRPIHDAVSVGQSQP